MDFKHLTPTVPKAMQWVGGTDGHLCLLDQTRLPLDIHFMDCKDVETIFEAIRSLRVRGAPAIGITAAYGMVIGFRQNPSKYDEMDSYLRTSRPTAVNLFWALDRMKKKYAQIFRINNHEDTLFALLEEAKAIEQEDISMCKAMGNSGAKLITEGSGVLTHCNAGALATSAYGTALAVIYSAFENGVGFHVFCDETRPLLQGARLTAWELSQAGVPTTLICDNMAAQVMKEGKIQIVLVGADRIAANGDTANKIGTYGVALLAKAHGIPFYVVAPYSTFDLSIPDGSHIPIELRNPEEITEGFGKRTAPIKINTYNPAFDVTPAGLITGIITERGIISPVRTSTIRQMLQSVSL